METLVIIGAILVILGIAGSIIPALPGPILSFLGIVLLFFARGAETISGWHLFVFGALAALLILSDYLAPILGAKLAGSTKKGTYGALIGGLIGIFFLPPLGIFVGAFIGAVAGEYYGGKQTGESLKAGVGVILGSVAMLALQIAYSVAAAIYFFTKIS